MFPNGTLLVDALERATDEGRYTCIARQNKEGKSAQQSVQVKIFGKSNAKCQIQMLSQIRMLSLIIKLTY